MPGGWLPPLISLFQARPHTAERCRHEPGRDDPPARHRSVVCMPPSAVAAPPCGGTMGHHRAELYVPNRTCVLPAASHLPWWRGRRQRRRGPLMVEQQARQGRSSAGCGTECPGGRSIGTARRTTSAAAPVFAPSIRASGARRGRGSAAAAAAAATAAAAEAAAEAWAAA